MKVREAIERLNKNKFNINYNCNKYEWELVIFDDENDITYEKENSYLRYLLQDYLNEEVEMKNISYFEDEFIKLSLNFTNFDTNDNYFEINYDDDFYTDDEIELKDTNDLIKVLTKTEFYVNRFMAEMQDNLNLELAYI